MPHRALLALFVLALALAARPGLAQTFVFHLRGDQEVPASASVASGGCFGELDQPAGELSLTCVHDVAGATVMHVHRGAAGAIGPVAFDLGDPASPVVATWTGMTPTDVSDLLAGNLYVNVHTAGRPDGEIRGQILPRTVDLVAFTADGGQVVPPNASNATASCTADLSTDAATLAVSCTHDVPSPQQAHVHEAPVLQNGPVVFTFASAASPLAGAVPMTPRLVADFAATFLYLDVLGPAGTEESPGVEIRGQIGDPPSGAGTGTIRIVKASFPAGGEGFGFTEDVIGEGFTLDDGGTQTFSEVPAGAYTVTEDDPAEGGFTLADVACDDADSTGDPFARTATVRLEAGEVVTCTFRNVEADAPSSIFVFHLSGDQEVPPVVTPDRGGCMGQLDDEAAELTLTCVHDVAGPTLMHIHRGASGVNGPVVFDLGNPTSPVVATWSGMTPADIADLLAGSFYVNVHTAGRPEGEIRGQILERTVDLVSFTADGGQVVPPTASAATGTCQADLSDAADELAVGCTHDLPAPDEAHLHEGARGTNGPLVFSFATATSPFAGDVPMTPRLVADFAGGFLYVDVHGTGGSEDEAGDQIRGQVGAPPAAPATGTIRIVKATSPAGGTGFGFTDDVPGSSGSFTLGHGQTQTFATVPPGTYTITEADPAGIPGGHTLTDVVCDDTDSTGDPFARTATIELQAGEVVTCTFHNLRSFVTGSIFVFHLSGDQEVPPVATSARGGCMGQLDAVAGAFSLVCTHDVAVPAVMHIHRGAAGAIGPIVFDLGDPQSPVEATWTGMTPADVADLLAGNLYVNVHAGGRPDGEIRGQILVRTVDSFSFPANGGQEVPPTDSTATGTCFADLSDDAGSLFVRCSHGVVQPTMIHLHDAPPGQEGPVVFTFPLTNPFSGNVPLTPRLVADFAAGFLYVNIHTELSPEGEIRGQLIAGAPQVLDIPTLGGWGAILLALSLLAAGWWRLR